MSGKHATSPSSSAPWAPHGELTVLWFASSVLPAAVAVLLALRRSSPSKRFAASSLHSRLAALLLDPVSPEDVCAAQDADPQLQVAPPQQEQLQTPAEAAREDTPLLQSASAPLRPPKTVTLTVVGVAVLHLSAWLLIYAAAALSGARTSFRSGSEAPGTVSPAGFVLQPQSLGRAAIYASIQVSPWVYVAVRAIVRPFPTPAYDVLVMLLLLLVAPLVRIHLLILHPHHVHVAAFLLNIASVVGILIALKAEMGLPLKAFTPAMSARLGYPTPLSKVFKAPLSAEDASQMAGPEDVCSLGTWLSVQWLSPLLQAAYEASRTPLGRLRGVQVWTLGLPLRSAFLLRAWSKLPRRSLWVNLFYINSKDLILDFGMAIVSSFVLYLKPWIMMRVLEGVQSPPLHDDGSAHHPWHPNGTDYRSPWIAPTHFEGPHSVGTARQTAYLMSVLGLLLVVATTQLDMNRYSYGRRASLRLRTVLTTAVYEKSLRVSGAAEEKGVSLVAVDIQTVATFVVHLFLWYEAPLQFVLGVWMLTALLGQSALVGVLVLFLGMPLQSFLARQQQRYLRKASSARDQRLSKLSALLTVLRGAKLAALADWMAEKVIVLRGVELRYDFRLQVLNAASRLVWTLLPALVTVVAFAWFTLVAQQELTIPIAFTALSLFALLSQPLATIPSLVDDFTRLRVALGRIDTFLSLPDMREETGSVVRHLGLDEEDCLGLVDATVAWPETETAVLYDITLKVREGLTVVYGPTGSGKTALLLALLGELTQLEGSRSKRGLDGAFDPSTGLVARAAYCSSTPWIQAGSIRANILFGQPMDSARYDAVLTSTGLSRDIQLWPGGDLYHTGQNGSALSGGQRARLALARALYSPCRTVVLDSVLASLDVHTARAAASALSGDLVKGRCVILATHQVGLVASMAKWTVKLEGGKIVAQGPPSELLSREEWLVPDSAAADQETSSPALAPEPEHDEGEATLASGRIPFKIYAVYLRACGWRLLALVVLLLVLAKLVDVAGAVWLSYWASGGSKRSQSVPYPMTLFLSGACSGPNGTCQPHSLSLQSLPVLVGQIALPPADETALPYVLILGLLQITAAGALAGFAALLAFVALRASRRLFSAMLAGVCSAPVVWLDNVPSGYFLTRFSADMDALDGPLLKVAMQVGESFFGFLTAWGTLLVALPPMTVPAVGVVVLFTYLTVHYLPASRDLRRLEFAARAPVLSKYSEAIRGGTTIRAFGAGQRLSRVVHAPLDRTNSLHYYWWMCNAWLLLRVDLVAGLNVFLVQILTLWLRIPPALAAVAITQSARYTASLYQVGRYMATLEQELTSVERIVSLTPPYIPHEPCGSEQGHVSPAWPARGEVIFEHVSLRYEDDPILHDVSFATRQGEKMAIVGPSGSGKSTLLQALLRAVDPTKGRIMLDAVELREVAPSTIRERVGYLAQDPLLWQGTLQENLDPDGEVGVERCIEALDKVGLALPLTMEIGPHGANLAQGERQLVALARALVLSSHGLLLADEPTAHVDFQTADTVHRVLRDEFASCTVLLVAHQLKSVLDMDRVLVLEAGRVVQFDTPANLLAKEGVFRRMAQQAGLV